ncbi:MAG: hypothetical protein NTU89_01975 [Candidatus Dependentiae bacterium]|nr:hypothetical protein [Candidatus Dependentiae bacterium]
MNFFRKIQTLLFLTHFFYGNLGCSQEKKEVPAWATEEISRLCVESAKKNTFFMRLTAESIAILIDNACISLKIDAKKNKVNLSRTLMLLYGALGDISLKNTSKISEIGLTPESYIDYCSSLVIKSLPEKELRLLIRSRGNHVGVLYEESLARFRANLETSINESIMPKVSEVFEAVNLLEKQREENFKNPPLLLRRLPDGTFKALAIEDGEQSLNESLPHWIEDAKYNIQCHCKKSRISFSGSMLERIIISFDSLIGHASNRKEEIDRVKMVSDYYMRIQTSIIDTLKEKELIIFPQMYKDSEDNFILAMKQIHEENGCAFFKNPIADKLKSKQAIIDEFTENMINKVLELEEVAKSTNLTAQEKDLAQSADSKMLANFVEKACDKEVFNFALHQKVLAALAQRKNNLLLESRIRKVSFEEKIFDKLAQAVARSYESLSVDQNESHLDVFGRSVELLYYTIGSIMNKEKKSFGSYISCADEYTEVFLDAIESLTDESLRSLIKTKGANTGMISEDGSVIFKKSIEDYLERSLKIAKLVKRATKEKIDAPKILQEVVVGKDGKVTGLTADQFQLLLELEPESKSLKLNPAHKPKEKNKKTIAKQKPVVAVVSRLLEPILGGKDKSAKPVNLAQSESAVSAAPVKALLVKSLSSAASAKALPAESEKVKKKTLADIEREILLAQESDLQTNDISKLSRRKQRELDKAKDKELQKNNSSSVLQFSDKLLEVPIATLTPAESDALLQVLPAALDDKAIALIDFEKGLNIVHRRRHDPYSPDKSFVSHIEDFACNQEPERERLMIRGRGVTARQ